MAKIKYHRISFPNKTKTLRKVQVCFWIKTLNFSCSDITQNEFYWWVNSFHEATIFHTDLQLQISLAVTSAWLQI